MQPLLPLVDPSGTSRSLGASVVYGLDPIGNPVHVSSVVRGRVSGVVCAGCGGTLVARRGSERAHHLAHASRSPMGEGCLHAGVKVDLYTRIRAALKSGDDVIFRWVCQDCQDYHSADLPRQLGAASVVMELRNTRGGFQPDITCFGIYHAPVVFIEVVDSHRPAKRVLGAGVPVVEVDVEGDWDASSSQVAVPVSASHNLPPCPLFVRPTVRVVQSVKTCTYQSCTGQGGVCHYCSHFWLSLGLKPSWLNF